MSATVQLPVSRNRAIPRSIHRLRVLAAVLLATLLFVEAATLLLRGQRQVTLEIERGVKDALAIRQNGSEREILFAGNSLIFEGVRRSALQQRMGSEFQVHCAGIPGSTYDDWRYGLRSLFQRGARPDVVVLGISPSQFLRASATTPLPVSKLWRLQEIGAYYRDQHPGANVLSELLLEHYSTFFYMRDTFRIYIRKAIPGYESMVGEWTRRTSSPPKEIADKAAIQNAFLERLSALQAECKDHALLVLVMVPTNQLEDDAFEPLLRSEADKLGVPTIAPLHEREWPRSKFQQDGYHLTVSSADEFSHLAGTDLAKILQEKLSER